MSRGNPAFCFSNFTIVHNQCTNGVLLVHGGNKLSPATQIMTATTIALLLALLLLPVLVLLWATESTSQRTHRLRGYGWSQRRIASHMGITRHQVRKVLAS